jgi:uncharacterized protein (TIGR03437 family)
MKAGIFLTLAVSVASVVCAQPSVVPGGVLNAGSFAKDSNGLGTAVAPGSLVAIFGNFPGATVASADTIPYSTNLGGISVSINGTLSPLQSTTPTGAFPFVTAQVPFEALAPSQTSASVQIVLNVGGQLSQPMNTPIVAAAPGIFTIPPDGQSNAVLVFVDPNNVPTIAGPASGLGPGYTYPSSPMPRGASGFFYATGLGAMTPPVADGASGFDGVTHQANLMPAVTIGGMSAAVAYAGPSGYPGVYQINVTIPQNAPTGDGIPLVIKTPDGSVTSNTAKVSIK